MQFGNNIVVRLFNEHEGKQEFYHAGHFVADGRAACCSRSARAHACDLASALGWVWNGVM
jgi:hypothetical protein